MNGCAANSTWIAVLLVICSVSVVTAPAADLAYQTDGTTGVVWSVGPDRVDGFGLLKYDPTNGVYSGGDILYPTTVVLSDGTLEGELLVMAIQNVNAIGNGLEQCKNENHKVPTPTLRSPMQWSNSGSYYLTTPIAYVISSPRDTKYGLAQSTVETKSRIRAVARALDRYYRDWYQYPEPPLNRPYVGGVGTLTSPVAYLNTYPSDPYHPTGTFGYQRNIFGYVLNSSGPDGDRDLPDWMSSSQYLWPISFVMPYDYRPAGFFPSGDIIYTSIDLFGESVWLDPFLSYSRVDDWRRYEGDPFR